MPKLERDSPRELFIYLDPDSMGERVQDQSHLHPIEALLVYQTNASMSSLNNDSCNAAFFRFIQACLK